MRSRKLNVVFGVVVLTLCFSACVNNPGVQGGDFAEHSSLAEAFSSTGNTTITLSQNEALDLTGIDINGRKEIFLNDHTLKLTGQYAVTEKGVIDIKPGEGFDNGTVDLSGLEFDLSNAPAQYPDDMPVIEIRSGANIIEPAGNDKIGIRDFGVLTAINVKYQN